MRPLASFLAAAACSLLATGALAATKKARCTFIADGKTVIDGKCDFESDADGSFRIWDKVHTVYVDVDGDKAEASWNGLPKSQHADTHTGTLARNGPCWENAKAKVCASALPRRK